MARLLIDKDQLAASCVSRAQNLNIQTQTHFLGRTSPTMQLEDSDVVRAQFLPLLTAILCIYWIL